MAAEEWREGVYRRIASRLWKDPEFLSLTDLEKLIVFYLLTGPQSNGLGLYHLSPALAAEALGTFPERWGEGFEKCRRTFGWGFDERARVLWIRTWWRYNRPANPNVVVGLLKAFSEVPKSPLDARFFNNLADLPGTLGQTFQATLLERYPERYPEPPLLQDQDQEQDLRGDLPASSTSQNSPSGSARATASGVDDAARGVSWLLDLYSTLPGTPRRKPTAADRTAAGELLGLAGPTICEAALRLGAQRKNGSTIGSVSYFRPLVDELLKEPPAYAEYVIQALQSGRGVRTETTETDQ